MAETTVTGPVVFFDGTCGFCNKWVQRISKWDKDKSLKFAPLQGTTAKTLLKTKKPSLDSILLWANGKTWSESDALIRILSITGGLRSGMATLLRFFPRPVRNLGYKIVARNRQHLSGKMECPLPPPGETRFLP